MSHKFVIVDEIMDMLEAAKSGVVPGSVCQAIVAGIQNVPSQIKQPKVGGASGTSYTTFPLSPIVKNCCIDKTYLNMEFDINFNLKAQGLTSGKTYEIPFYFGFRDTASLFNQVMVMIENSTLWQTVYQREESVLSYNSLPETEIRGNNQYASIDKMINNKYSPMKRIVATITATGATENKNICVHFKTTCDINRLTPLLSNLHFTTPHMGNLRLKVFLQEIEKALFFCPDYNYIYHTKLNITPLNLSGNTASDINTGVNASFTSITNNSIISLSSPKDNAYWCFYPLNENFGTDIASTAIPFIAINTTDGSIINPTYITFDNPTDGSNFMDFGKNGIAEIIQTCFDIKDIEYQRLTDHFASLGSVIIPTQTWSTSVFNNSEITSGYWNESMVGNVGGYNIDFISVWFHSNKSPSALNKEFLNGVQLILDGRPINAIRYDYINDKCIVDMTQAIIDTDHEEINHDYIDSLTFLNLTDTTSYINTNPHAIYGDGQLGHYMKILNLRNPNSFCMNFSTNLPNAFHSGACIIENSNRQAVVRLLSSSVKNNFETDRTLFPVFQTHFNNNGGTTAGFSCFCDACIVLTYDAARGVCYDGQLSWAAPYA